MFRFSCATIKLQSTAKYAWNTNSVDAKSVSVNNNVPNSNSDVYATKQYEP